MSVPRCSVHGFDDRHPDRFDHASRLGHRLVADAQKQIDPPLPDRSTGVDRHRDHHLAVGSIDPDHAAQRDDLRVDRYRVSRDQPHTGRGLRPAIGGDLPEVDDAVVVEHQGLDEQGVHAMESSNGPEIQSLGGGVTLLDQSTTQTGVGTFVGPHPVQAHQITFRGSQGDRTVDLGEVRIETVRDPADDRRSQVRIGGILAPGRQLGCRDRIGRGGHDRMSMDLVGDRDRLENRRRVRGRLESAGNLSEPDARRVRFQKSPEWMRLMPAAPAFRGPVCASFQYEDRIRHRSVQPIVLRG